MADETKFDVWGMLELFGHQRLAGKITEQTIAGHGFVRIDVPEVNGTPGYSRMFGPTAVYGITPTTEKVARDLALAMEARPIQSYDMPRQIGAPREDERDF